ncbi:MFS transporter, NHS family, xanthosine permease [Cnuella takakiae]|uniref:MFS transporter, NHS family, xanthosine permease n=1 Tax=Cnuella takakiae TaxID=1302690 RepID=A0A1M5GH36_9BACT|nr:nucleoside permease [Cnuella takakiae]OLY94790.1 MFS transporter [Cnuella takakiae]SHG03006.1 MFS transporter, NHS family, xanthosine permease [Cnuella takakiae]
MNIKFRLTVMSFFQFFVWGAWLITIGTYCFNAKGWTGAQFGAIFSTMALSSLFMPALTGILADKVVNAEKLYGILHILYGAILFYVPQVEDPQTLFYVIFAAMICYMPTISLSNSIAYTILKREGFDVVKVFPPIRVWGTIGFIAAMWTTNLTGSKANANQFIIGAIAAIALGIFSFTLPKCPPQRTIAKEAGLAEQLGLQAFKLFANYRMALFFIFSMMLGGALQLTNMYGDTFLDDFRNVPQYADSFVVKYSTIIMSISQISETVFILSIPFFLKRFGIKQVMLFSMLAWVLRFGLFAYGDPAGNLWMIILSCIVYGMAFDFFNISGSLFVEMETSPAIRSSAQGIFMMMTNGVGAYLGSTVSGYLIDAYYTTPEGGKDWHSLWLSFAGYAFVVAILFQLLFRYKHKAAVETVAH